ncbi:Alpha/beta hydrolase fold-1 [Melanogaster broomeanus]|nr:Alpha/beta hydrolase fold-1 [Melanogaster broomeanus]
MSTRTLDSTSLPSRERHVLSLCATLGDVAVTLQCSALRYPVSHRGVTLLFTHGITGHKEEYHPVITRLLRLSDKAKYAIREIWSIDFPNHGETAILNRAVLDQHKARGIRGGFDGTCTTLDYAVYLNAFLASPPLRAHDVVGMAHSGSCTVWVHALTKFPNAPSVHALILLEPTLMFPSLSPTDRRSIHGAANVRGALAKRDRWSSRADARRWLLENGKGVWTKWDERVLDLFMEYAFEDVSSSEGSYTTPTLRKDEESPLYACLAHTIEPSQLARVCAGLSADGKQGAHIIWAEVEEFISKTAKADIVDAAGHRVATQRTVKSAGHLVPQQKPDELADALIEVLSVIGRGLKASL